MSPSVLLVEDETNLADAVRLNLEREGFDVRMANDGVGGLAEARRETPDIIVLDIMLPDLNGLEVCRALRRESDVPILMLTALGEEVDKVVGLELGADDYVTKPFSFTELVARVEAVLRRSRRFAARERTYGFGDVQVDFRSREVAKGGRPLTLQPREFRLLEYFIRHRGEAVSRDRLLEGVWDLDAMHPLTRTVDMHVAKLRQKIEDDVSDPRWIVTVHRVGYKFTG
jgi:DNA-binding response OmpR family regulator